MLPQVVKLVREFLNNVNIETGKSENRFNLAQLDQQLVFKNGEAVVSISFHRQDNLLKLISLIWFR